ncbi:MAG: hypothetical protein C0591_08670 [Marinilabiliales bacterium]|nr:MAG: hypothetical protein C0591_08670 [Marinilabiliales bacterium]
MKKATIILLAIVFPLFMIAQTSGVEKLFKKYENVKGFELEVTDTNIDIDFDGDAGFLNFLDEAESFYILNFEFGSGNQEDLKSFKAKLNKTIDKEDYTTILDMSGEEEFRLLVLKGKADKINAILMITSDEDDASFILVTN